MRLKDIAKINETNFRNDNFDNILYLDTSSATKGVISNYLEFSSFNDLPSRAKRAVKDKTIVYSTVRPNLEHYAIFDKPQNNIVVSTGFATIDTNINITEPKYIYYFLTQQKITNQLHTIAMLNVSAYPSINPSDLENLDIKLPPLPTQTAIAKTLSLLDDKITLNNKINAELEEMAREIYEWYFVQNKKDDWEIKKLKDVIALQKNGDWGEEQSKGNYTKKVICIRGADINALVGNEYFNAPKRYILTKNTSKILQPNDFIIEISGGSPTQSTGRIAYLPMDLIKGFDTPLICSNFCKAISLKSEDYFYWFYFLWQKLYSVGAFFGYEGKTSGIKNFLFDTFVESYDVIIPPQKILQEFQAIVKPMFDKIVTNRQENFELATLRDWLLPMLMNGQVVIKGGDINECKTISLPIVEVEYQNFKEQIGLAARGDIDEQTIQNIYKAHREKVGERDGQSKNRKRRT
ncbi:MAG: restriction endonuclease subunit S [Christensenellaceae bacterium]|jgi:type I restriction enzyme S subunit|nr:restriction endonuclease subunit S [Christensenellaceae bacterium]